MIDTPGIYQMTMDTYQSDPCIVPSLSSGIARTLLADSARHAWFAHPRLNAAVEREEREIFDLGNAAHAYLLEGESNFAIIEAKDWRTKVAQEARDSARLEGKTPLLAHRWADVQAMATAAREQLAAHNAAPTPFTNGKPEQVLIWCEGDVWCRARLDWLHADGITIDDYKSTGGSANPDVWTRALFNAGLDIQEAFYRRGLAAVGKRVIPGRRTPAFRFIVQENYDPFALSVVALAPDAQALADRKVARALELWAWCRERDRWPGYPASICYADLPPWEEPRFMERELREAGLRDDGRPIGDQLAG